MNKINNTNRAEKAILKRIKAGKKVVLSELARELYNNNPLYFTNVEGARGILKFAARKLEREGYVVMPKKNNKDVKLKSTTRIRKFSSNTNKIANYMLVNELLLKLPHFSVARILYGLDFINGFTLDNYYKTVRQLRGVVKKTYKGESKITRPHPEIKKAWDIIVSDPEYNLRNPYILPKSDEKDAKHFYLPKSHNNILFMSDLHFPYHNIAAINAALDYGIDNNVNTIYLNGDVFDNHHQSKYEKDPNKRSFKEELDQVRSFLHLIRTLFPNAHIYFKIGNHDVRWERFCRMHPKTLDITELSLYSLLNYRGLGITEIGFNQIAFAGKLPLLHGHEYIGGGTTVNAARRLFNKAKMSAIQGHNHQTSEHSGKRVDGTFMTTFSVGCMCELNPDFMPFNEHNHGFAHIRTTDDGSFHVRNFRILNGVIL